MIYGIVCNYNANCLIQLFDVGSRRNGIKMRKKFSIGTIAYVPYILIALAGILSFGLCIGNEFTFDDFYAIRDNPQLHKLSNLRYIFNDNYFEISREASFRPVVTGLNIIEYHLFGDNPAGYHLINLILHIIVSLLLYRLFRILTKNRITAAIGALLHAVHPVISEAVLSPSFVEDILCAIFLVAATLLVRLFLETEQKIQKTLIGIGLIVAYLLALGSKEMAFFYPLGLFILLPYLTDKPKRGWVICGLLAGILAGFMVIRFGLLVNPHEAMVNRLNPVWRWQGIIVYFIDYLWLYLFPVNLSIIHELQPVPPESLPVFLVEIVVFLGLAGVGIYLWKRKSPLGCALLWTIVSFIPVSGIVPLKFPFAERYLYIPAMGLHLFFAVFLAKVYNDVRCAGIHFKKLCIMTIVLLFSVLLARSMERTAEWKTETALWMSTARTAPHSPVVYYSLGKIYQDENRLRQAMKCYNRAIRLNPSYLAPYMNLAAIFIDLHEYETALQVNAAILEQNPDVVVAHLNNAHIFRIQGMREQEFASYKEAIRSAPDFAESYKLISRWYLEHKRYDEAARAWTRAISLDPHWTEGYIQLTAYYNRADRFERALYILERGVQHNPNDKQLRMLLLKQRTAF